jgi:hypothetical protein
LFAGAARAVITPPLGIRMMGYTVQESVSRCVERELTATALVLSDGRTKAVVLACDLLFIQNPHVDRIRAAVGRGVGVPAEQVLINCSHKHLGPMLPGWQRDSDEQQSLQERYLAALEDQLAGVAAAADGMLEPARLGVATGHASLGVNRRERLADGRVIIGENHTGPVDNEIGVVRIDRANGRHRWPTPFCWAPRTAAWVTCPRPRPSTRGAWKSSWAEDEASGGKEGRREKWRQVV